MPNSQMPHTVKHKFTSRNWLVHRIHDHALQKALEKYARGVLLDVGCGDKPYHMLTNGYVDQHIGLDHVGSFHSKSQVEIFATAYETGISDNSIDTVLCTFVLEHLEYPQKALDEFYRVTKPGGHIILSAPLFWHLHEEPRDFYRYTKYGFTHLFTEANFEILQIKPLSGFIVTFGQEVNYFLNYWQRGLGKQLISTLQIVIQGLAYYLNRWDQSYQFTWAYLIIGRKNDQ